MSTENSVYSEPVVHSSESSSSWKERKRSKKSADVFGAIRRAKSSVSEIFQDLSVGQDTFTVETPSVLTNDDEVTGSSYTSGTTSSTSFSGGCCRCDADELMLATLDGCKVSECAALVDEVKSLATLWEVPAPGRRRKDRRPKKQ